jgi:hypothetical protein
VIDTQVGDELQYEWISRGLGDRVPLGLVECADRRLIRGAVQAALTVVVQEHAVVTLLLPRRSFRRVWQRLLHDRTADRIAAAAARIPHVAATIVPFDTTISEEAENRLRSERDRAAGDPALVIGRTPISAPELRPAPHAPDQIGVDGVTPIGAVQWKQSVTVEGRVTIVQVGTATGRSLEAHVFDSTGGLRLLFFGRTRIPGIAPGAHLRATGRVGDYKGHLALANPKYELLPD